MSFCAGFFEFFADKVQRGQLVEFGPDFRLGFAVEAVDVGTYLSGIPLGQAVAVDDFGPYFTTSVYDMTEEITCDYSELDSFVIFICVEGSCRLTDDNQNEITLRAGETVLLPAAVQEVTIVPEGQRVKLLETYV